MKIAVLSDIHDHLDGLEKVLRDIGGKVETIVFCGDLISPFTTGILAKANLPTYAIYVNKLRRNYQFVISNLLKLSSVDWVSACYKIG